MPKVQWTDLPPALREHLFDRLRTREISAEDLYLLKLWRESEPDAPDGPWYKDFGTFKLCGGVTSRKPTSSGSGRIREKPTSALEKISDQQSPLPTMGKRQG